MDIIGIHKLPSLNSSGNIASASKAGSSFSQMLSNAVNQINQTQQDSNQAIQQYMNGQTDDLHNVMISVEKSSIVLQTAVATQNKAINAYQEIMRMQV